MISLAAIFSNFDNLQKFLIAFTKLIIKTERFDSDLMTFQEGTT